MQKSNKNKELTMTIRDMCTSYPESKARAFLYGNYVEVYFILEPPKEYLVGDIRSISKCLVIGLNGEIREDFFKMDSSKPLQSLTLGKFISFIDDLIINSSLSPSNKESWKLYQKWLC